MRQRINGWLLCYSFYTLLAIIVAIQCVSIANAQRADETNDETAMAIPHMVLPGSDRIDLPHPLSPGDVALIKRILQTQARGAIAEADRDIANLHSDWMVGPILAARYLRSNAHPTAQELSEWLSRFGEQSDSQPITELLRKIDASNANVRPLTHRHARGAGSVAGGAGAVRALFSHNRDAEAVAAGLSIAAMASNTKASDDFLTAGLAAWRQNDKETAIGFFAVAFETAQLPVHRAAAAYWMAHAKERSGQPAEAWTWLRRAASDKDTFYGRIARRKLGLVHLVDGDRTPQRTLGVADFDRLLAIPRARRAFGLMQIGDRKRAENEFRALSLDLQTEPDLQQILMAVAETAGMPYLAEELRTGYSTVANVAERKVPFELRPMGGFIVDPTIVYGIVQHESNFHTDVVSSLGALGLMQIMPQTAHGIGALLAGQANRLREPSVNLWVGQRYIVVLENDPDIHGDLLRLLAAYGQGQGAMKRWVSGINDGGDPLMFLESVPSPVLRGFLFDALTASWRYAVALHMPAPSLDAIAQGQFPTLYHPLPVSGRARQPAL